MECKRCGKQRHFRFGGVNVSDGLSYKEEVIQNALYKAFGNGKNHGGAYLSRFELKEKFKSVYDYAKAEQRNCTNTKNTDSKNKGDDKSGNIKN